MSGPHQGRRVGSTAKYLVLLGDEPLLGGSCLMPLIYVHPASPASCQTTLPCHKDTLLLPNTLWLLCKVGGRELTLRPPSTSRVL